MHPLIDQTVMLAEPHKSLAPTAQKALEVAIARKSLFEVKWDGVRCLAHVHDGTVVLRNRRKVDISQRYPEVTLTLAEAFPTGTYTFDGEIVAFGEDGLPNFDLLAKRDRLTKPDRIKATVAKIPTTFLPFDVLMDRGHDLRKAPFQGRRIVLEDLEDELTGDHLRLGPSTPDGESMWEFVDTRDMEGLIAKLPYAPYTEGRSAAWVKLKRSSTASFIVTGFEEGTGRASDMVGALYIAQLDGSTLVQRGKVGTGFSQLQRMELYEILEGRLPLNNGRPWHWDANPLIVEVEYASVTKDGSLRFPSFQRVRRDQGITDCTTEQA